MYKYLFPFERVIPHSRILIYGAGVLGQEYYKQLSLTNYCEIVGFVDKNYRQYAASGIPVYSPAEVCGLSFDYVVVALRMAAAFNEIKRTLFNSGVEENRIIAVFERNYEEKPLFCEEDKDQNFEYVGKKDNNSIALLTTGGFGDMVIQKRLVMELVKLLPDCSIDIYNIKAYDFLKILYTDIPNIKNIIPDLGSRYNQRCREYSLAITVEACHFIKVDVFDKEYWDEKDIAFSNRIKKLVKETMEEGANISMPAHVTLYRRLLKGCNVYTGFNYNGVFDIKDEKVNIPLDKNAEKKFVDFLNVLGIRDYITINCGNGDCADASVVAKSWPLEYYSSLITRIKRECAKWKVIQLGNKGADKIINCDAYMLGEEFSVVEHVLKHSCLHIDIEGGLVHIASQLGTKCIVLFGPTVKEYYGYENNVNISVGNCHNCWGLYTDVNKCARGLEKPECMYSIKPDKVFTYVKKELKSINEE